MAVGGITMERVIVRALTVEILEGALLPNGQEAEVLVAGEEGEACVGLRWRGDEVGGELRELTRGDETAALDAAGHLSKECHRHFGELVLQPLVCFLVDVFVAPECREA